MGRDPGVLVVFGTRPEAIKLGPVITALRDRLPLKVCVTAQHRQMLDQVLQVFGITPDFDLDLMLPKQDLFDVTARALMALRGVISSVQPQLVVVQGDTTTTFAAALAAFYLEVEVAHVEAGLRTRDKWRPFPEEVNRRLTSSLTDWHFAPTSPARDNLLAERVPPTRVFVTGNTGIDAVLSTLRALDAGTVLPQLSTPIAAKIAGQRVILVTGHRRESFGGGFERICQALRIIAESHPDVVIVYPVHLNPNVQGPVHRLLGNISRVMLVPPLDYVPFVALMRTAEIILTDSGGIQEEAPSLGRPVLVMRDTTERPEGVEAGVARIVGTEVERIVQSVDALLADPTARAAMATRDNPYGDGRAAERIASLVTQILAGVEPAALTMP